MKPLSVLIADDEENISTLVQMCVIAEGHQAVCVAGAREAKAAMARQTFDLVITDVLMPDGDGLDLITQLRRVQPATRVLAISGGGRFMETNDCLKWARGLGANAAVMKPFTREQLLAGIAEALA